MATFNDLLCVHGIEPARVAVLRHAGRGRLNLTPHDLWLRREDGDFHRYQSTQNGGPIFDRPIWASFVRTPAAETVFAGLYLAAEVDAAAIDWNDPMTGMPPGRDKGYVASLYELAPIQAFAVHVDVLKIEWDRGRGWARYAERNDFAIAGDVDLSPFMAFDGSCEGERRWIRQERIERDPALRKRKLDQNVAAHGGAPACEACAFRHPDRGLFDVHHKRPLQAGPRRTVLTDLLVLCPTCHRRAHRGSVRALPDDLDLLQAWNAAGRP